MSAMQVPRSPALTIEAQEESMVTDAMLAAPTTSYADVWNVASTREQVACRLPLGAPRPFPAP